MKNIHVLLANTDRRTNNLVQAAVLDVCYNQAAVDFTKISRVDELAPYGRHPAIQLILLSPGHLLSEPSRGGSRVKIEEVAAAVRTIKQCCLTPVVALNVSPDDQVPMVQVGTDVVIPPPFPGEAFRAEIRHLLKMSEIVEEEVATSRWSFAALFT